MAPLVFPDAIRDLTGFSPTDPETRGAFLGWVGWLFFVPAFVGGLVGMQLSRIVFTREGLEARREAMLLELRQRIRDVRQGPDGLIYMTTDMPDGAVLKLEPIREL